MKATSIARFIDRVPKPLLLLFCFLFILALGIIRFFTGPEYALTVFFMFPVVVSAWFIGRWIAVLVSFVSIGTWLTADLMFTHRFSHSYVPFVNETFRLMVFLFICYVISELKALLKEEGMLARTDSLTHIPNRRAFFEALDAEVCRARRYLRPCTIVSIDLDNFKYVNDNLGHQAGDNLLRAVGMTMQQAVRGADMVARVGGDEFFILMPETGAETAQSIISRINEQLLARMRQNDWPVTFSMGIATFTDLPGTTDEIVSTADTLLYAAKRAGKNMVKFDTISSRKPA